MTIFDHPTTTTTALAADTLAAPTATPQELQDGLDALVEVLSAEAETALGCGAMMPFLTLTATLGLVRSLSVEGDSFTADLDHLEGVTVSMANLTMAHLGDAIDILAGPIPEGIEGDPAELRATAQALVMFFITARAMVQAFVIPALAAREG